jgi:hypothetical protein
VGFTAWVFGEEQRLAHRQARSHAQVAAHFGTGATKKAGGVLVDEDADAAVA